MSRRHHALLVLGPVVVVLASCAPSRVQEITPDLTGAAIQIHFDAPRLVVLVATSGDSTQVGGVRGLVGRLRENNSTTITLSVTEVIGVRQQPRSGLRTSVRLGPGVEVRLLSRRPGATYFRFVAYPLIGFLVLSVYLLSQIDG